MTKSAEVISPVVAATREPRPLQWLQPVRAAVQMPAIDARGLELLQLKVFDSIPQLVRSIVDHTIALQNRRAFEAGDVPPMRMSVLNRRRRAARSWLLALLDGKFDAATQHALCHQWVPTLAGNDPDVRSAMRVGQSCVEFLRGALTALVFDEVAENLLPHARALHSMEQILGAHLAAIRDQVRPQASTR